jgi:Flavivirus envelope glycoprotein M
MESEEVKPKNLIQKLADWISRNPYFTLIVLLIALVADVASMDLSRA